MAFFSSFVLIVIMATRLIQVRAGITSVSASESSKFTTSLGPGISNTDIRALEGTISSTSLSATSISQPSPSSLPPASGSLKGMNYNAQAGYDYYGQFKIAHSLGFSSARLYTMIEPYTTTTPIAALQAAALSNTSVLLGIWLEGSLPNELAALKSALTIPNLTITGLSCGNEDLYRNTQPAGGGTTAANIVACITQAKALVGGRFPVGHADTYQMWATADGKTVADAADFVGYNGYPYWEGKSADAASVAEATYAGLANITSAGITKPVWVTETGWPVSGNVTGAAVPGVQNAASFYQTVGCGILFPRYNAWWYTLEDESLAAPHFGVMSGPGESEPLYSLECAGGT